MKKIILVFFLIKLISMDFGFGQIYQKHEKKITKVIAKEFRSSDFIIEQIIIGDGLNKNQNIQIYTISSEDSVLGYLCVNNATACRVGGCPVYSRDTHSGNYELFSFAVFYDFSLQVKQVKILEYAPEYGYEITSSRWLRQFIGNQDCNIQYNEDVDAISGATISARSLIDNVNHVCEILHENIIMQEGKISMVNKPDEKSEK